MGREVRRVPANWQHPKVDERFIPLHGESFSRTFARWKTERAKWREGFVRDYSKGIDVDAWKPRGRNETCKFEEWYGERPQAEDYMPDWSDAERTHWQMYENTSEGTPISPVMATADELARWLADNGASAFAGQTASYEAWLATINRGWAPSAMLIGGSPLVSGVEALAAQSTDMN